ncbi:hypothetical protein BH23ACT9_BH23ACT9_22230 [soil metagenome]
MRSWSPSLGFRLEHDEQVFEDGYHRSATKSSEPYQPVL